MDNELKWYVIYTKARAEKKINERLNKIGIDTYLPLIKTLKQWSDRKKKIEVPLINSYIFVKANKQNYLDILQTDGVAKFIKFNETPATIPDSQIFSLKLLLNETQFIPELNQGFMKGDIIEIKHGIFKGFNGEIIEKKGKHLLVVNINQLNISVSLEISVENVLKV